MRWRHGCRISSIDRLQCRHHGHKDLCTLETTACLLCGADTPQPIYELPDLLLGLPGSFYLVRCSNCGLVYQNPRPRAAEIGFYYPEQYDSYVMPPWANPSLLARMLQLYGLKKRWKYLERWAPTHGQRRILDVGCATGAFLAAGSHSWSKVGVELSATAANYARDRFGLEVHQGVVEDAPLPARSFDVVTLWDVLEHLYDPIGTLCRVRELLRPDGILVGRVPNVDSWEAKLSGRYWAGLDQPRHIFVPGGGTLEGILRRAGFVIQDRRCLSGSAAMLALSWRFWVRQHVTQAPRRRLVQKVLDNLVARVALLPLHLVVDTVFKKGALLAFVARPEGL
jgi:SAM-dependent methyltransferase